MATTTAIPLAGEVSPKQFNGPPPHCRRKMKKVCCCLTFLLVINFLLTLHISHDICRIAHLFYDNDMVLMPGGETSFCNDFCADLCVNSADRFTCDIVSCLNNCNLHFGNEEIVGIQVVEEDPMDDVDYDAPPTFGRPDEEPAQFLPENGDYYDDTELYFDNADVEYYDDTETEEEPRALP